MSAEEIRELRVRLGMTQNDLAARIGVRGETICKWESGRVKPSILARLALRRLVDELAATPSGEASAA